MATLQFTEGGKTPPRALYRNKQLSNNIVDGMARSRPSAVYSEIPRLFDSYEAGYRKVTYGALANGINAVAGWLKEKLGESQNHQTLAYIGLNDLGYVMMILGAVKAGYKVIVPKRMQIMSTTCLRVTIPSCFSYLYAIISTTTPASSKPPGAKSCLHPLHVHLSCKEF